MKKHLYFIAFLLCLVTLGCTSNEGQLKKYVEEANKTGPGMIDETTRLDSLSVQPGLKLVLHHTIVGFSGDLTPEQIEMLKFEQKVQSLNAIITSNDKEIKRLLNAGVTFCIEYRDMNGNFILDVDITPEDYKNAMK